MVAFKNDRILSSRLFGFGDSIATAEARGSCEKTARCAAYVRKGRGLGEILGGHSVQAPKGHPPDRSAEG